MKVLGLWHGRFRKFDRSLKKLLQSGYYDYIMFGESETNNQLLHWLKPYVKSIIVKDTDNLYKQLLEQCDDHYIMFTHKYFENIIKTAGHTPITYKNVDAKLLEIHELKKKTKKDQGILYEGNTYEKPKIIIRKSRNPRTVPVNGESESSGA